MNFKIGKVTSGEHEFGEIYHMACAYIIDRSVTVEFNDFARGEEFHKTFIVPNGEARQPTRQDAHPGESANVIRDRYCEGCMKSVCDAIHAKAKQDAWNYPACIKNLLTNDPKVLLWHRTKKGYKEYRNSTPQLIKQLAKFCCDHNTVPILIGESGVPNSNCHELVSYWNDEFFNEHSIAKQLWCLDALFRNGRTLASLGVMSGAMDGAAMFFGHKTIFLARHSDATPRMQKVSTSVPNLMWHQVEYSRTFSALAEADLSSIARKIWC